MKKVLRLLGTRGIPAAHGGFETFAERLALYLVGNGWRVIVYCQEEGTGPVIHDTWHGVERVRIFVKKTGSVGAFIFDWHATVHAAGFRDLCLSLGYNTAIFALLMRLKGIPHIINMDGIEWSRAKFGIFARAWLWFNERAGCWLGNHLIADHPEIKIHLQTRITGAKITTIPYGADPVTTASPDILKTFGLKAGKFLTVIARSEPENSILEIVEGFSAKPRGYDLVILGHYVAGNSFHQAARDAASSEVKFIGATYDKAVVQALRFHSLAYVHGHQVGGTNPSLVEALGAGNAVIAHDNRFNRWVAGEGAIYFTGADSFSKCMDELEEGLQKSQTLRRLGQQRFQSTFTWPDVLSQYENLLERYLPASGNSNSTALLKYRRP